MFNVHTRLENFLFYFSDIDECDDEAIESSCEFGCVNTVGSYYCEKPESENDIKLISEDLKTPVTCAPGYQTDSEGRCVGKC